MSDAVVLLLFVAVPPALLLGARAAARGHRRAPTVLKLVAGNVLALAGLVSLALPVGEAYYRFAVDTTDAYQASRVSERWVARHYRTNNAGVRDDVDYPPPAPDGAPRILVLGDSFTNGHGVADVDDRFANRLRARRAGWSIELLAADGLDTGALLVELEARLRRAPAPDVVLYAYCLNDISDLMPELDGPTRRLYEARPWWIVRHSYLLDTWWWRVRIAMDPALAGYFERLEAAYADERWTLHARRLERWAGLVRDAGARPAVMTWPFFELMDDPGYRAIHDRLDGLWRRLEVPHRDLLQSFEGESASAWVVNARDTHPDARAHAVAADAAEALVSEALGATAAARAAASSPGSRRTRGSGRG